MTDRCANCFYFRDPYDGTVEPGEQVWEGDCRKNPPVALDHMKTLWPTVGVDQWCGEFRSTKVVRHGQ